MDLTFTKNDMINDIFINYHREDISIQIIEPAFQVFSFIEKIGGSHQINKDWKISECNTVVLKPKLKEVTFNRELLSYYVLSTSKEFKQLYTFMASFLGLYSFNKELYIGVSNIVQREQVVGHRIIDVKIGHFCFDKLMYGSKPEKELYYKKGWRVIGTKDQERMYKYIGELKKGPEDGHKEEQLLKGFLFNTGDEEKRKTTKRKLLEKVQRIKEYFEDENRIDVISGSILISIEDSEEPRVDVKIIDLAHTYFYSEATCKVENKKIFFNGIKAFMADLEGL